MTSDRRTVSTGTEWERIVGFSRATRVANFITVSGTTATDGDGNPVGIDDPAAQTAYILEKIRAALAELGAGFEHVVRTRIYVTNADDWEAVGRVHGQYFAGIQPANTLVEVSRLVGDAYLVEIEADAYVPDSESAS